MLSPKDAWWVFPDYCMVGPVRPSQHGPWPATPHPGSSQHDTMWSPTKAAQSVGAISRHRCLNFIVFCTLCLPSGVFYLPSSVLTSSVLPGAPWPRPQWAVGQSLEGIKWNLPFWLCTHRFFISILPYFEALYRMFVCFQRILWCLQ